MNIYIIEHKTEEKFLREKTKPVDIASFKKGELQKLARDMRHIMKEVNGVGLSANQIGLPHRMFVAEIPDKQNRMKFYAVLNPTITKTSSATETLEEGCLSVPETYGLVARAHRLTLEGMDVNGKKIKIKAWGLLARIFQHETDHLNGALFIDKAKNIQKIPASERLIAREEKMKHE